MSEDQENNQSESTDINIASTQSNSIQQNPEPMLLTIGDIGVTQSWIVTPNGNARLKGSTWITRDMSRTETKMPAVAIVLAILFFVFCFLGLLFLLMKETTTTGYVEVQVQSENLMHITQVPVNNPQGIDWVRNTVHQAQSYAAQAI